MAWNLETLEAYLQDVKEAEHAGRNLVSEKYGYMMEHTSPAEYLQIKKLLPDVGKTKEKVIGDIMKILMEQTELFFKT